VHRIGLATPALLLSMPSESERWARSELRSFCLSSKGLLRQPGGFKGFGAVGEDTGAADLPVFEVVNAVRAATLRGVR
jgi:hypothetical protein